MSDEVKVPGKGKATASLVLGIIGVVLWFTGYGAIISLVLGIIGIVFASQSKKEGFTGGLRTAGFVLSLISLIVGALVFACVACIGGAVGCAACTEIFANI